MVPVPDEQPIKDRRFVCSTAMPYNRQYHRDTRWQHPDAKHTGDDYGSLASGGSYAYYKCPHCGQSWSEMLPD